MKLHEYPVIVVVFGMPDCPMCQEYSPRFSAVAERYVGCVPSAMINTETVDEAWLKHYKVVHVPATMVIRYGVVTARRNSAVDDKTIQHLFALATMGRECELR
jgi:thioredoxin-like negative regulator of GroEL